MRYKSRYIHDRDIVIIQKPYRITSNNCNFEFCQHPRKGEGQYKAKKETDIIEERGNRLEKWMYEL